MKMKIQLQSEEILKLPFLIIKYAFNALYWVLNYVLPFLTQHLASETTFGSLNFKA